MRNAIYLIIIALTLLGIRTFFVAANRERPGIHRIAILGYDDDAMEPFVTRDGRYLLFNNRNEPAAGTDIHYAERQDDFTWRYRGKVNGVNTPDFLEGCPTMDSKGDMFFVSTRSYAKSSCTIYSGTFRDGQVTDVHIVESISRKKPGVVNFDVDVSPDGKTLYFVDSNFRPGVGPQSAELVIAEWDGSQFVRSKRSAEILALVNAKQPAIQYAPAISADGLSLYFTRFDRASGSPGPQIYRATRKLPSDAFIKVEHLADLGDFVEGPALSPDEHLLYFHRKDGNKYRLFATRVP